MNRHIWTVAALASLATLGFLAQSKAAAEPQEGRHVPGGRMPVSHHGGCSISIIEGFPATGVVSGAPFAAVAVLTSVEKLPDGNRITHERRVSVWRDAEGRVRREEVGEREGDKQRLVCISNPVDGFDLFLDPGERRARKVMTAGGEISHREPHGEVVPHGHGPADREEVGQRPHAGGVPGGGEPGEIEGRKPHDGHEGVRPHKPEIEGSVSEEPLGSSSREGLTVVGVRHTRTIPAGAIGNERPVVYVTETWTAPDLKAVVEQKVQGRGQEQWWRLTEVRLGDPDPALFAAPEDYNVQESGRPHER